MGSPSVQEKYVETQKPSFSFGRTHSAFWIQMNEKRLSEHRPALYSSLILNEKLYPHLLEANETVNHRLDMIMPELVKSAGVTEQLKSSNPMKWVGLMITLKAQAEEVILSELIYT